MHQVHLVTCMEAEGPIGSKRLLSQPNHLHAWFDMNRYRMRFGANVIHFVVLMVFVRQYLFRSTLFSQNKGLEPRLSG